MNKSEFGLVISLYKIIAGFIAGPGTERFLLSCSRSPELVQQSDIMEFELDGSPAGYDHRQPYLERFIHGAVCEARPDINAVVHSHAEDVLPFGIAPTPLRPVIHSGGFLGQSAPVWDIARYGLASAKGN